jgi:hypothetical protein
MHPSTAGSGPHVAMGLVDLVGVGIRPSAMAAPLPFCDMLGAGVFE